MPAPKSTKASPPGTRERILTTAIKLFAAGGFDGASVNDIVAEAGVNKRMVYHYFANKAGLYQEALYFAYREMGEFEESQLAGADSLEEVVRRLIRVYFTFPRRHPEFTRLIMWENLSKGKNIRNSRARLTKQSVIDALQTAIDRDADGVRWRTDLEARELFVSILGLCQVYAYHRYTLSQALGFDLGSARAIKAGIANAERILLAGMRPDATT